MDAQERAERIVNAHIGYNQDGQRTPCKKPRLRGRTARYFQGFSSAHQLCADIAQALTAARAESRAEVERLNAECQHGMSLIAELQARAEAAEAEVERLTAILALFEKAERITHEWWLVATKDAVKWRKEAADLANRALPDGGEYLCFTRGTFDRMLVDRAALETRALTAEASARKAGEEMRMRCADALHREMQKHLDAFKECEDSPDRAEEAEYHNDQAETLWPLYEHVRALPLPGDGEVGR